MLNDIYPADQFPDFKFGARPQNPQRTAAAHAEEPKEQEGHDIDIDKPPALEAPLVCEDFVQQLLGEV